ncbi:ECF transporter S component [Bhargavaea ullalensis]|uniref:Riboflavin transporter FmnP n=1 Tax=Bhargavaea ullalensis TaxID=1265685 RepID=A0ABV2GBV1_9BACL
MKNPRLIALTALISAMCAVGAFIKIPLGVGSAALDSSPALVSAVFLPPAAAGVAAMVGHFVSALTAGAPLGPLHILIAGEMFVIISVFAFFHRKGWHRMKWWFFIVANGFLAVLPFYWVISPAFFAASVAGILAATFVNAALGAVAMPFVQKAVVRKGPVR